MLVQDLMQTDVKAVAPDRNVAMVVQTMADSRISGIPVVGQSGKLLGVVSSTDVLQGTAEHGASSTERNRFFSLTTAQDIMTVRPHTIGPDADVQHAAQQMLYLDVRRLFVVDDGRLVGVISQTDIAHAMGSGRL